MKPQDVSYALCVISECSRNGTAPPVELIWWALDGIGAAVVNGTSIDEALGIRDGGKSINRSARMLRRKSCLREARGFLAGSDRAVAQEIAERIVRLEGFEPGLRKWRIRDEADGLILQAMEHGATANAESIRKILR